MTLGINAHRWGFLRRERASAYIETYERIRKEGWKQLAPPTTRRQFATGREILDRMNQGQRGVLLADDVGLGKTTVAALCALVFAGSNKSVRILAPNEMMSRRWRQELEIHVDAVATFAKHLDLDRARRRLGSDVQRLNPGAIAVSTHQKAGRLMCDLLIVDEAHRARGENSTLGSRLRAQRRTIGRVLVLTATPFSIDPKDLARLLGRIGGHSAEAPMRRYAQMLDDLWRGKRTGPPEQLATQLVDTARTAVEAMRPYVIRHGIDDLPANERGAFGSIDDSWPASSNVPDGLLDAMLRTDRALALGGRCGAWDRTRTNDPRYHVASGKLDRDLSALLEALPARGSDTTVALARRHGQLARRQLRAIETHPKVADSVRVASEFVAQGEKVLVFCDHHHPAVELSLALVEALRWRTRGRERSPSSQIWRAAWAAIFAPARRAAEGHDGREQSIKRLDHFVGWLQSDGIRTQIASWFRGGLNPELTARSLRRLLETRRARNHAACETIATHALQLYEQLVDRESGSTRAILQREEATALPGATKARVVAACDPDPGQSLRARPGVFYPNQPDATLAVFNSPFGPEVLVTTDRLSEGVDLHRFCRHLIHHELDPSPVRTVQRNGRLRRVNSWAARTGQPIRILYPALLGTRDEKLVAIMRYRLLQFDLLLGGVRADVDPDDASPAPETAEEILAVARGKLGRIRLGLKYGPGKRR